MLERLFWRLPRELAKQVYIEVRSLLSSLSIKAELIVGGENYNDQVKALRHNPQIIVGTAGRVADHLSGRTLFLNGLEILVYDEADRMLGSRLCPRITGD